MSINQRVIKSCIITLMVLILIVTLAVSVNAVCVNPDKSQCPCITTAVYYLTNNNDATLNYKIKEGEIIKGNFTITNSNKIIEEYIPVKVILSSSKDNLILNEKEFILQYNESKIINFSLINLKIGNSKTEIEIKFTPNYTNSCARDSISKITILTSVISTKDLKKCVSSCIKDSKNISKECDSNFKVTSKKCRTDYSYCLNHAKDSKNKTQTRVNIKNCNLNYTSCRSFIVSIKDECKNNITLSYNNMCLMNSQNNQANNNLNKIDCNWRPYRDSNGCYAIFGDKYMAIGTGQNKTYACGTGAAQLGYYYNDNICVSVSGFGIEGNFTLFNSKEECEQKCLP